MIKKDLRGAPVETKQFESTPNHKLAITMSSDKTNFFRKIDDKPNSPVVKQYSFQFQKKVPKDQEEAEIQR